MAENMNPYANPTADPTIRTSPPNTRSWHETGTLPNGWKIGRLGALWYVLDEDGWAISEGYHEIDNAGNKGKLGTTTESISLRGEPATR